MKTRLLILGLLLQVVLFCGSAFAGHWVVPASSPVLMYLYGNLSINGSAPLINDEVGVFDSNGVLIGLYVSDGDIGSFYGVLAINGDQSLTSSFDEGASSGEALTIKVWRASTAKEYSGTEITLAPNSEIGTPFEAATLPLVFSGSDWVGLNITATLAPDLTKPVTTASPSSTTFINSQTITLTANEPATIYYATSGATPTQSSTNIATSGSFSINSTTTVKFFAKDSAGNVETPIKTEVYTLITPPGAPTGAASTAGNGQATVTFTAPSSNGGSQITGYTVTSSNPGNGSKTASGSGSPITVTGLTNGSTYTFTVVATNEAGNSASSTATGSVTPKGTQSIGAITLTPATLNVGGTTVASATASSGLAVTFASNSTSICTVSGSTVTGKAPGTCTITASQGGNAAFDAASPVTKDIVVAKATLTITAAAKSKTYGTTDPELTYTVTGLVAPDTMSGTLTRAAGTNVGDYAITQGTVNVSATGNYNVTFTGANLTIGKAALGIIADAKSKTYGAADPALSYTTTGLVSPDTMSGTLTRAAGTNVGDYAITQGTVNVSAPGNYNVTFTGANLTIGKAALGITAAAKSKTYGTADPELTYTTTGLVSPDTMSGTLTRAAGTNIGDYAITQGTVNVSAPGNYNVTFTGANLTIGKAALGITAAAKSKTYGTADPELTYTTTGLVSPDTMSGTLTRAAGTNVGDYAITQGTVNVSAPANYNVTYTGANLTIGKAALGIIADAKSKAYGEADPALTYTTTGLVSPDTMSGTLTWAAGTNVGDYAITQGTVNVSAPANYNVTYTGANLSIGKTGQTIGAITFSPATLAYGQTTTASATATSGLAVTFTSNTPSCTVSGATVTPVTAGTCTIAANQVGDANYSAASPTVTNSITITAVAPGAPTITSVTPGNGQVTVAFTAPGSNGGSQITGYTVTSSDPTKSATGTVSPITVTGLTNNTPYTFTVNATNQPAGTGPSSAPSSAVTPRLLTPDISAPSHLFAKTGNSVTFTVTYTGAEAITLATSHITLNKPAGNASGSVAVSGTGTASRTVTISGLTGDGTLGITIAANSATSGGGAIQATPSGASATFTVDNTPPVLAVTTPADATRTSNNTATFIGTATDANAVTVKVNTTDATVNGSAFTAGITLSTGSNSVSIVATDAAGNSANTTRSIFYDDTNPTIIFTAPTPGSGSTINLQAPTIAGTISEPGTVSIVVNNGAPQAATMNGLNFSAQIALSSANSGLNTVDVTVTDLSGRNATDNRTITFDNDRPALEITDPLQDITTTLGSYLVKGTVSDTQSSITLTFAVNGVPVSPAPTVTSGAFEKNVVLNVPAAATTYAILVTATDAGGNTSTASRNIIYRPLSIADALRALKIAVGAIQQPTAQDLIVLDVAPLKVINPGPNETYLPEPDTKIDIGDALVLLRKTVDLVSW